MQCKVQMRDLQIIVTNLRNLKDLEIISFSRIGGLDLPRQDTLFSVEDLVHSLKTKIPSKICHPYTKSSSEWWYNIFFWPFVNFSKPIPLFWVNLLKFKVSYFFCPHSFHLSSLGFSPASTVITSLSWTFFSFSSSGRGFLYVSFSWWFSWCKSKHDSDVFHLHKDRLCRRSNDD